MNDDILIKCDHVSRKFCKDLKRSLWYELKDVGLFASNHYKKIVTIGIMESEDNDNNENMNEVRVVTI
jgi:hypothetical protein